jgi:superfamily II DNA or RNA helicase
MNISEAQILLFKDTFRGRDDIYATRWEKENKSGYMPAYFFDPYLYRAHKMKGGTFKDYSGKTHQPLTNDQIKKHISGEQLIGIYPLLQDNTSWFIAADFDGDRWKEQCKAAWRFLSEKRIPVYLERSRSGNGGHLWIFFEKPYPAVRSRKILLQLLQEAGVISVFDKASSFDRLFPNQDFLSGKGFGNLIALPLHDPAVQKGNSCFIDPETYEPYSDQWQFLQNIRRISLPDLDKLYKESGADEHQKIHSASSGKLSISLGANLTLSRDGLTLPLVHFLKEELNFANTEFIIKKKMGKNAWNIERYFRFIEEAESEIIIPKGMAGRLLRFCKENGIENEFNDDRKKHPRVLFNFNAPLREFQQSVIQSASKKDMGVIVAPPGSGKTIMGLKIIVEKQQPALIVVHRKQLADQWMERIQSFLGITKSEIGRIGQGKGKLGEKITVGMIQSLAKEIEKNKDDIRNTFGTIIIDECHHVPAETFRDTISKLNTHYQYGLTATPFRKYNDGKLIFIHLGEIIAEVKPEDIGNHSHAKIIVRNTELDIPFNSKTDKFETLSKVLIHDSSRNKLILNDIISELKSGKKVAVITERKEHIDALYQFVKQSYETITLSGDDSEVNRNSKWKMLKEGNFQALITTGQYFGEGSDLNNIQSLFLVYPFSFEGKLIQYIGRVQRSEVTPTIYDYRDYKIEYLNKLFLKRNTYYRKIEKLPTLFDEPEVNPNEDRDILTVEKKIKIPIDDLEFRFGTIAFRYSITEVNSEIEFEIENLEVRPEFEVLKAYFSKHLQSKTVIANIFIEFENGQVVSQIATSEDIEKINREVIEGVKFRFLHNIISSGKNKGGTLLDIKQVQESAGDFYNSGEELLEDVLKNDRVKHYQQLRYLADKHESSTMKLRFILSPFSFVFLISGEDCYHVVLETLDTEEATYIWHFPKIRGELPGHLKQVDENLNIIRNKGRQQFLQNLPSNFSRVLHDYSDKRKGFIIWRDILEERLT